MLIPEIKVLYPEVRTLPEFDLGDSWALRICGESGCGKTTYLNSLALELKRLGKTVLYQNQSRNFPNGYTPFSYARLINAGQDFFHILSTLDLDLSKDFSQMSGGELQRVAIGECLVSQCEFILLDETFNAIDAARIMQVIRLLGEHSKKHQIVIIYISHLDIEFENEQRFYLD